MANTSGRTGRLAWDDAMRLEEVLQDNRDLRQQVTELKTQLDDALNRNSLLAQERDELALWIGEHQREQGKIR